MTSESLFDPTNFLNAQQETGELSTQLEPIPEGDYSAVIDKVDARQFDDRNGEKRTVMDVTWKIDAPNNDAANNRKVRQSIFLDVNGKGMIDNGKGKNIDLGRLLAAVNKNNGSPWSPASLIGNAAKVKVSTRVGEGNYAGRIFNDVGGISKL